MRNTSNRHRNTSATNSLNVPEPERPSEINPENIEETSETTEEELTEERTTEEDQDQKDARKQSWYRKQNKHRHKSSTKPIYTEVR